MHVFASGTVTHKGNNQEFAKSVHTITIHKQLVESSYKNNSQLGQGLSNWAWRSMKFPMSLLPAFIFFLIFLFHFVYLTSSECHVTTSIYDRKVCGGDLGALYIWVSGLHTKSNRSSGDGISYSREYLFLGRAPCVSLFSFVVTLLLYCPEWMIPIFQSKGWSSPTSYLAVVVAIMKLHHLIQSKAKSRNCRPLLATSMDTMKHQTP